MEKAIYFDMDGTLADFYGVENWLEKLRAFDTSPYKEAKPLINLQALAHRLNALKRKGYTIGIISWLSAESNAEFDEATTLAKLEWLNTHLRSVKFDEIHIVAYGEKKSTLANRKGGLLFDDNMRVRKEWTKNSQGGWACSEKNILAVLEQLK